ncbi:alanine racemase [Staphylococcus microti]|uniref:Alanine racemase n=1 Tax=Staphylococcus microti TaxID=569857 RepID=A0A0D6XS16_9STAP|nr:alanine racemase [Staphylococcus microti]KIX91382.1 alanine racemase [Staphylococcus microti]PNZ75970.1 alanine racemase [Staphylococcus microti]SUM58018.1 alanine racemase 1 [Staphylococcus microti]
MSEKYYRNTTLTVNLDAITSNYQALAKCHPDKMMMPVVKANAYGLGSVTVANHLAKLGVTFVCVATLDEAIELRMHGFKQKILILSSMPPENINKAIQHRVAVAVPSKEWLVEAIEHMDDSNEKSLWLHIKLDTGMNRLGIKDSDTYAEIIALIAQYDQLIFEGVFSHFASADEENDSAQQQYQRFEQIVSSTERPSYVHIQNSAGTLRFNPEICNACRPGIALYGYYPSPFIEAKETARLTPAASVETTVTQVKRLEAGESIGYGETYTASERMTIAVLPIGYADGYLRSMQGATMNVNGNQCEVVGRVSMDQTAIRVPAHVKQGDKVVVMEARAHSPQSVEALAEQQGTINYEVLCNFGRRIPRVYVSGEDVEVSNELLK